MENILIKDQYLLLHCIISRKSQIKGKTRLNEKFWMDRLKYFKYIRKKNKFLRNRVVE